MTRSEEVRGRLLHATDPPGNSWPRAVRLRHATLLALLLTLAVMVAAMYLAGRLVLLRGFEAVERRSLERNVGRARDALHNSIDALSTKVSDWSAWDDTCRFIADRNDDYVRSNLNPESLRNLEVEVILFYDTQGRSVAAAAIDDAGSAAPPPDRLLGAIAAAGLLHHESPLSERTGVLVLEGDPVLVASRPIVTSANLGPVRGSVVFVRRLTPERIDSLGARTHLDLELTPLGGGGLDPLRAAAVQRLRSGVPGIVVETSGDERITGYELIPEVAPGQDGASGAGGHGDAGGGTGGGLLLRVSVPRDIYRQGLLSMSWLLASIIVVGVVVTLTVLVLMHVLVVSRVERLSSFAERIAAGAGEVDDSDIRVGGVIELQNLAGRIRQMVHRLTAAYTELERRADELKVKGELLDVSRRSAEAANQAKTEFLANMSHEIRTPMTAVLGYTDLLMEQNLSETDRLHHLGMIQAAGRSLLATINDILDISRIEAGQLNLRMVRVRPADILAEVIGLMRPKAEAKDITLEAHCDSPFPEMIATDPARLRQILSNIIGNAVKFTEQGRVSVAIRATRPMGDTGPTLSFEVSDTGPGMKPELLERVFQPFFQADSSTTRRHGGTGLGLCISKRLAEALGGAIHIGSTPGSGMGTTVLITIDPGELEGVAWTSQLATSPAPTALAGTPAVLSGRILVADDTPENRRLLMHVLRKAGAEVAVVEDGSEAVRVALAARESNQPFSLIIMDMQMPVMDGYTATARLRAAEIGCPILALTAFALSGEREKCLAAGCDDYATKPIDRVALTQWCASWLAQQPLPIRGAA